MLSARRHRLGCPLFFYPFTQKLFSLHLPHFILISCSILLCIRAFHPPVALPSTPFQHHIHLFLPSHPLPSTPIATPSKARPPLPSPKVTPLCPSVPPCNFSTGCCQLCSFSFFCFPPLFVLHLLYSSSSFHVAHTTIIACTSKTYHILPHTLLSTPMLAIVAPIDIQPASRTSPSSKGAMDSHESLADSGYESSWPSLMEAAAWLPPSGQRRKGSLSSSDLGGADLSDSSDNLGLETGDNRHSSYARYCKSTADDKNQKNTSSRHAKSQRRRARTQAYQAKRMSQSQGIPLVDIGSPNMDDDGHNHEIAPPVPIPLRLVLI